MVKALVGSRTPTPAGKEGASYTPTPWQQAHEHKTQGRPVGHGGQDLESYASDTSQQQFVSLVCNYELQMTQMFVDT